MPCTLFHMITFRGPMGILQKGCEFTLCKRVHTILVFTKFGDNEIWVCAHEN